MGAECSLTYAAVTPARDEERNLARLAESLLAQSVKPVKWIIVENGSQDGTLALASALARAHPWIEVMQIEPSIKYRRTIAERAFQAGVEALAGSGDLVAKVDADVSFGEDYFCGLLRAFEQDEGLGIASGACLEEHRGAWREVSLFGDHCFGQSRVYRRACLDAVLPLEGAAFTTIDETKARLAGFCTRTLRHLPYYHNRPEATNDGSLWESWHRQGVAAYQLGYRPSYLLMRSSYRAMHQRSALALIVGYVSAFSRRMPRYPDARVVGAIRDEQRMRRAFLAMRGTRGGARRSTTGQVVERAPGDARGLTSADRAREPEPEPDTTGQTTR